MKARQEVRLMKVSIRRGLAPDSRRFFLNLLTVPLLILINVHINQCCTVPCVVYMCLCE